MMKYGSLIDYAFIDSDVAPTCFSSLLKKHNRKQFGLLESPATSTGNYDGEVSYKIFLCGKAGVGKTSIVSKVTGTQSLDGPSETIGIQVSNCYWPVRIIETEKIVLFKLSFWDVGEQMLNAYNHILPSCLQDTDCVLYVFSLTNKTLWEDLPKLITRIDADDRILKICVGTRSDLKNDIEITNAMIGDFEQIWKCPIIKAANTKTPLSHNQMDQFRDVALFLNKLCELLWYRDQVKAGLIQQSLVDYCFLDGSECQQLDSNASSNTSQTKWTSTKVTFC